MSSQFGQFFVTAAISFPQAFSLAGWLISSKYGHVGLFPTADYNVGPVGNEQWPADKFTNTTIFWVQRQKG